MLWYTIYGDSMKNKDGFTLAELLAVIVIIGILSLVVAPAVVKQIRNAQQTTKEQVLKNLEDAALDYALDHSKNSTFISNNCAVNYIVNKSNPLNLPSGCDKKTVSVNTLIDEGFYKDDSKKTKKDGIITIYKYKTTNNGKDFYDLKVYVDESLLN